LLTTNMYLT